MVPFFNDGRQVECCANAVGKEKGNSDISDMRVTELVEFPAGN